MTGRPFAEILQYYAMERFLICGSRKERDAKVCPQRRPVVLRLESAPAPLYKILIFADTFPTAVKIFKSHQRCDCTVHT